MIPPYTTRKKTKTQQALLAFLIGQAMSLIPVFFLPISLTLGPTAFWGAFLVFCFLIGIWMMVVFFVGLILFFTDRDEFSEEHHTFVVYGIVFFVISSVILFTAAPFMFVDWTETYVGYIFIYMAIFSLQEVGKFFLVYHLLDENTRYLSFGLFLPAGLTVLALYQLSYGASESLVENVLALGYSVPTILYFIILAMVHRRIGSEELLPNEHTRASLERPLYPPVYGWPPMPPYPYPPPWAPAPPNYWPAYPGYAYPPHAYRGGRSSDQKERGREPDSPGRDYYGDPEIQAEYERYYSRERRRQGSVEKEEPVEEGEKIVEEDEPEPE